MPESVGNIVKFKTFLTVADLGSFNAAAKKLGYTQAGISYTINSLEKELGLTLFLRTHNGVTLTSEGRALYPSIEEICNQDRILNNIVNELNHMEMGRLRVSVFTSIYVNWFAKILRIFLTRYPKIRVDIVCCDDFAQIDEMIGNGSVDCAFCTFPEPEEFSFIRLIEDPIYAILPEDHPLAGLENFPMDALGKYPYVNPGGSFDEIDSIFQRYHVRPQVSVRSENDYATLSLVEAGFGYTLFPKLFVSRSTNAVIVKELEIPQSRIIGLVTRNEKKLTGATKKFIAAVLDWCRINYPGDDAFRSPPASEKTVE